MVIKESAENEQRPIDQLKKDLLTNNTNTHPVNYVKEMERKKKIFMTENIEEEGESKTTGRDSREAGKFIAHRNTRYDNHLTESSQVPELTSKVRKLQGMNLIKSNSSKKLKHLDTNQVIEDCDIEMTNYQNLTIEEDENSSEGGKRVSTILQNKINDFMTNKTDSSYSRRFPRLTNDTTLGSIMNVTEDPGRGKFLTLNNNKVNLGNYQIIENQFRTNKPNKKENVGNSQYLRTVVQRADTTGNNWETKIDEEEGVEMGEIMIDESGGLKREDKSYFENQLQKLKEEQMLNDLEFQKAKKNPNNDLLHKQEDLSEDINKSIHSDLFEDNTPKKREVSKSPELLVIGNDAPVKKRTFRLGKSRKKTPKKKKRENEENDHKSTSHQNETVKNSNRVSQQTKNLDIEMPEEVPKAIEIDLGFNSTYIKYE